MKHAKKGNYMNMNKLNIVVPAAAALAFASLGHAEEAASPHTLTGNFGLFSQYVFRGLTQTNEEPAAQGGFDYSHSSGFYAGTWASNVSWLRDFGAYADGGSLEWDVYGGFKGTLGESGLGYDVGLLYYWYPGDPAPNVVKADTTELYAGLSWQWLSAKLSYSIDDDTFGVADSRGTYYADLTANIPIVDKLTGVLHYGIQEFDGATNDVVASYKDWKIGVNYALPKSFTLGAFFTGTDMTATQESFYTTPSGKELGDNQFVISISRAL